MAALILTMLAPPVIGATPCNGLSDREAIHYTWRLRGGLSWLIGLRFPSSGVGVYETSTSPEGVVLSRLRITASRNEPGHYLYESEFDVAARQTRMSRIDYKWGSKSRDERTSFDYEKRLARVDRISAGKKSERVRQITSDELRDILTGIHSLRVLAPSLRSPFTSQIYSDGKFYPVLFRRGGAKTLVLNGQKFACTEYLITAVPGSEQRWPGGLHVWLTDDERKVPVKIELKRGFATLELTVSSLEECSPKTNVKLAR